MDKKLLSEDEVKAKLGITDFRSMKKEQIIDFVSSIPEMDKEVAIECIKQFPHFKEFANDTVSSFYSLCETIINEDNNDAIEANRYILNRLEDQLNQEHITEVTKQFIIGKMVDVGNTLADLDKNKRSFKETITKIAGIFGMFVISAGGALLGLKITKK